MLIKTNNAINAISSNFKFEIILTKIHINYLKLVVKICFQFNNVDFVNINNKNIIHVKSNNNFNIVINKNVYIDVNKIIF